MADSIAPMPDTMPPWPAIDLATRRQVPRVPFAIDGVVVGSVAHAHLPALAEERPTLRIDDAGVQLTVAAEARDATLARINLRLRGAGLIRAWRDETYPVPDPASLRPLALIERAASRFWGTLTFGAHCNGYVAGPDGRPAWLWIAQRSFGKATDPGAHDNLVGGGVPHGQSPFETLVREGWEEAGLPPARMRHARPGRVLRLHRDIPEGLQHEWLHVYDLALAPEEAPANQDGEVHAFTRHPLPEALAIAGGSSMTADASLVTLDFVLRHGLLPAPDAARLAERARELWVPVPGARP